MTSKAVGIDSESLLFAKLQEYSIEIHNLIFRRQYNDRRKITLSLCNTIRERLRRCAWRSGEDNQTKNKKCTWNKKCTCVHKIFGI